MILRNQTGWEPVHTYFTCAYAETFIFYQSQSVQQFCMCKTWKVVNVLVYKKDKVLITAETYEESNIFFRDMDGTS